MNFCITNDYFIWKSIQIMYLSHYRILEIITAITAVLIVGAGGFIFLSIAIVVAIAAVVSKSRLADLYPKL